MSDGASTSDITNPVSAPRRVEYPSTSRQQQAVVIAHRKSLHTHKMESNPAKRRKTGHLAAGEPYAALSFDTAAASAGLFRPSTFILETAELLEQSRVDYAKLLPNSEELLRNVKTAVESVETHGPVLVSEDRTPFIKPPSDNPDLESIGRL